jgi:Lrp/AsnC family transcriptional regulator, leucine-responsive regulatory protein
MHIQRPLILFSIERMENNTSFTSIDGELDGIDWNLLKLVQTNARMSYAELGRQAGLSPPAAAERLRRLEDSGVIVGYHAKINPARIGLCMPAIIEIRVNRSEYQRFQKAIQKLPSVLECHHIAGRASFILKVAVRDTSGLERLLGHLTQFGETATSVVLSTVFEGRQFQPENL